MQAEIIINVKGINKSLHNIYYQTLYVAYIYPDLYQRSGIHAGIYACDVMRDLPVAVVFVRLALLLTFINLLFYNYSLCISAREKKWRHQTIIQHRYIRSAA